jgi:hypothetical protein
MEIKEIIYAAVLVLGAVIGSGGIAWSTINRKVGEISVVLKSLGESISHIHDDIHDVLNKTYDHEGRISTIEGAGIYKQGTNKPKSGRQKDAS